MLKPVARDNYGAIGDIQTTKQDKKLCTAKVLIGVIAALLVLMVSGKVFFGGFDSNGENSMQKFSKFSSESDISNNIDEIENNDDAGINEDNYCCQFQLPCCG